MPLNLINTNTSIVLLHTFLCFHYVHTPLASCLLPFGEPRQLHSVTTYFFPLYSQPIHSFIIYLHCNSLFIISLCMAKLPPCTSVVVSYFCIQRASLINPPILDYIYYFTTYIPCVSYSCYIQLLC